MDVDLDAGMVVTVEPGVYFVPAILRLPELRRRFEGMVDFARAEEYTRANGGRGFGGVRIENDLLVTPDGHENLTPGIPEDAADVEAAVGGGSGRRSGSGAR
jgi:Xaa-Pro aminopeptidase/Xaa-Pro dipeptidase